MPWGDFGTGRSEDGAGRGLACAVSAGRHESPHFPGGGLEPREFMVLGCVHNDTVSCDGLAWGASAVPLSLLGTPKPP